MFPDPTKIPVIRTIPGSIVNYRDEKGAAIVKLAGLRSESLANPMGNAIFQRIREDQKAFSSNNKIRPKTIDAIIRERRYEHGATFGNKFLVDFSDNPEISEVVWAALLLPRFVTGSLFALSSLPVGPLRLINPFFLLRCVFGFVAAQFTGISDIDRAEQTARTILEGTEQKKNRFLMEEKGPYDKDKKYSPGAYTILSSSNLPNEVSTSDVSLDKLDVKVYQKEDPWNYSYHLRRRSLPEHFIGTEEQKNKFREQWCGWIDEVESILPGVHAKTWFIILKAKARDLFEKPAIPIDQLNRCPKNKK